MPAAEIRPRRWRNSSAQGRIDWISDLAEIPAKYGVTNVYGDIGQSFAEVIVAQPRLAAAFMGTLIKGLGVDRVVWGTDALWTGSPQWQIEGLRRLEIPAEMQKKFGFAPLGPADGPVKNAIFGGNTARLYHYQRHAELLQDRLSAVKNRVPAVRRRADEPALRLHTKTAADLRLKAGPTPDRRSDVPIASRRPAQGE